MWGTCLQPSVPLIKHYYVLVSRLNREGSVQYIVKKKQELNPEQKGLVSAVLHLRTKEESSQGKATHLLTAWRCWSVQACCLNM